MTPREPLRTPAAAVYSNGTLYCIDTYSGRGRLARDPQFASLLLPARASDEELGAALVQGMSRSRLLTAEEHRAFFNFERIKAQYEAWVQVLLQAHGLDSRDALFREMAQCTATSIAGEIVISPSRHSKPEAWEREDGDGIIDVVLSSQSDAAALGGALRRAFALCHTLASRPA